MEVPHKEDRLFNLLKSTVIRAAKLLGVKPGEVITTLEAVLEELAETRAELKTHRAMATRNDDPPREASEGTGNGWCWMVPDSGQPELQRDDEKSPDWTDQQAAAYVLYKTAGRSPAEFTRMLKAVMTADYCGGLLYGQANPDKVDALLASNEPDLDVMNLPSGPGIVLPLKPPAWLSCLDPTGDPS